MEDVLIFVGLLANLAATVLLRVRPWPVDDPPALVDETPLSAEEAAAPEWGTRARWEWHRSMRNYHIMKMAENGRTEVVE